jgi:hypothetical protein
MKTFTMPVATALAVLTETGHEVAQVTGAEATAAGHAEDKRYVVDGAHYDLSEVRVLAEARAVGLCRVHKARFVRVLEIRGRQCVVARSGLRRMMLRFS